MTRGEHIAFFDVLGSMRANDARWTPTMAGFVTVRLVDKWAEALHGWLAPRPSEVAAVREAIEKVPDGPIRNALAAIVDAITQAWGRPKAQVSARVLAYATLLDDRQEWALAADVYRTFLAFASETEDDIVARAWHRLGVCERWLGRFAEAEQAHESARDTATRIGERYTELAARHGLAIVVLGRGNLPQADEMLSVVIAECEAGLSQIPGIIQVLVRAVHDQGVIAMRRKQIDRGFALLSRALVETTEARHRDRVLHDLSFAFTELGLRDTARRALLVLELTAQQMEVRWTATLNLMHLATLDGWEMVFERHRRSLVKAPLPPRLAVLYQIDIGAACRRFGRETQARDAFNRAIVLAERHQLNDLLIEAETARDAKVQEPVVEAPARQALGCETVRIIEVIEHLSADVIGAGV
jgi:tetratricopeptide (TPR) repeat protein